MGGSSGIRRSRFLVTYWENGAHQAYNYLTRESSPCPALAVAILDAAEYWTSREAVCQTLTRWDADDVHGTIDDLIERRLLEAADRPPLPGESALRDWAKWNPVAGFFHGATKAIGSVDPEGSRQRAARLLVDHEFPATLKQYRDRPRLELPACSGAGRFPDLLRARRTWREFGERDLSLGEVTTLLGLTFGVQRWLEVGDDRWVALKTSPSGGARHSIEAYLLAFHIEGLENGTYHYCPDSHTLTLLQSPTPPGLLVDFLPTQVDFHNPPALVVMTSVFARVQWKYQHPYAYRVVLLDAGHLGQTFALVATALGLAPFCTAALDAPRLEQHLGIDGISEAVIFAVGVG